MQKLLLLVLVHFLVTSVHAQKSKATFSCVMFGELPYSEIYYANEGKAAPMELIPNRRSEIYSMKRSKSLKLYVKETNEEGKLTNKLVGQAEFPATAKRMLFIILKSSKKEGLPLSMIPVEDSLNTFPLGTFRIANFTSKTFNVDMGSVSGVVAPKDFTVFKPKMSPKGGLLSFIIKDKKDKHIFGRRLFGQPRSRELVIIIPTNQPKKPLRILTIPEVIGLELPSESQ